jgi:hypothetical protein
VQVHAELVDQVEPHERPTEASAAPDDDVAVAATHEIVDLFCRVTSGDGGAGPLGRPQSPGEDDLARGVHDAGKRVAGRRQGSGHALVGGAAHDVRVCALVNADLLLQVRGVDGQAETELPVLGALVGEKAVQRVHEHPRNQLAHDQNSSVSIRAQSHVRAS